MASKSLGVLTLDLIAKTGGFEQGMDKAQRSSEKWRKRVDADMKAAASSSESAFSSIAGGAAKMAGAIGLVLSTQQIIQYADGWSELNARVANVVGPGGDADSVMRSIATTARSTYSSLNQTAEAFLNNATALTELGYTTEQQLQVSDALNNALVISATRGQQAESVMQALSKSMAAGVLRGDNWNTVLQSGGRIVQALADGLGVTTIELRKMAEDGLLTTEKVVTALTSQLEVLRAESDAMAAAVVDGVGQIGNSLLALIGITDQSIGASGSLANALVAVADAIRPFDDTGNLKGWADNLHLVADAAAVVALVVGSRVTGAVATSAYSFALATKESIRYQATLAQMAGVSTVTATRLAALSGAARAASTAMAVVGGPVGAVVLAAGALTYFATRASEAEREAEALERRVNNLGDSFDDLSVRQARKAIEDYQVKLAEAVQTMQTAEARAFTLQRNLEQFPNSKKAAQWAKDLITAGSAIDDAKDEVDEFNSSLERLNGIVQAGGAGALADDAREASEAFQKLNRQLTERLALVGLGTEAERLAARVSGGYVEGLKVGEGELLVAIQQQIDAREASIAAEERAAKAAADARKSAAQEEKSRLQGIANEITALERAAATWGMTADEVKIYGLEVQGATQAQLDHARSLLQTTSGLEKAKQEQEAYLRLVQDLRTDEERLTDQLHERLAVLDAIAAAGGVGSDQYQETAHRIVDGGFTDAPEFGGLAPEVAGPFGELSKIDEAQEKLQEWYDTQLEMLEEFRAERADLAAQWDAQELALKQEHEDELARIEQARQMAQLAAAESIFGDLAGLAKTFAGEQSGIYKAMFAVQKAASIAQSVVAIQTGIAMAAANPWPANLAAMASVAAATASIVGNIAAVGMAHDGIDSVPQTGTWLLQKGERVTTAETSAKLDRTLERVASNQGGGAKPPNLINNGPPMTMRQELQGDQINYILELAEDRMSSSVMKDGKLGKATRQAFGLRRYAK